VRSPHILCHRVSASSMAQVKVCPMCSEPVTFGGGMTMMNFLDSQVPLLVLESGVKYFCFSHQADHADSTCLGL